MRPLSTKSIVSIAKRVISTVDSVTAAATVVHRASHKFLPVEYRREFENYIFRNVLNKFKFSNQLTMVFYECDGIVDNEIYHATQRYLVARMSSDSHRLKVTKHRKEQQFNVALDTNMECTDVYNGVHFTWSLVSKQKPKREHYGYEEEKRSSSLELTFHPKHKDLVLNSYLPYIINAFKTKKQTERTVKLFTLEWMDWTSVNLDHPATFETVALDPGVKEMVMRDLDRFIERREYYRRVGKAWKRGYLLYGPPGTGKSSLIAAIANYLNFDIYDLELSNIKSDSELRRLLVATANRSILVVEDIDCSVELHDRAKVVTKKDEDQKVTLSGFLNFIDGLWSSCGDERIIVFTTNRKDKLDPALIRPGRMDVHIHMSYCTPGAFRVLVSNYLSITKHSLLEEIDELIGRVDVTPAEVAEQLLKDDDPDIALGGLIEFLDVKRKKNEEPKAKLKEEEEEELGAKEVKKSCKKKFKRKNPKRK